MALAPAPAPAPTPAPAPAPATSALASEIADCFKMGPTAFSVATGIKGPDGTIYEAQRTEVTPAGTSSATPNVFIEAIYSPVAAGGSYKSSETSYQLTALGLQRQNISFFSTNGALSSEFYNYSGYMPTALTLGVEQRYSENFSVRVPGSSVIPVINASSNVYSIKLLSVGPLVTAGKTFSSACEVRILHVSANGRAVAPSSTNPSLWFAKNFGVVKGGSYDASSIFTGTEVVRVITPPAP